jgi:hypothetical protein
MRIDIDQQLVTQVRFDFAVSILTLQGTVVRVQNDFLVSHPGDEPVFVPIEDLVPAARPVMRLFGQVLESAETNDAGALSLVFQSGARLDISPDASLEPWSVNSASGGLLVGLPGGGTASYAAGTRA